MQPTHPHERPQATPKRSQRELAITDANAVLSNPSLGVRFSAANHGVHHTSHVHHWLKKWKGTEMDEFVAEQNAKGMWLPA